ncbi:unnamed protein product [Vitrella brassicaformis CCMP3155]|uniref:Chromatin modification-related protein MEAF6 n=1 Tax=Vitrella brassicaformis (strain CCMP3155) TaxID=1169540 RepID=A0A0G4F440_VITBC|nr:unnamed protein product [Vitrella brassicaformis CCMP3155]|mmetsp:Transcript_20125/g.48862  ORF Transcript_20125/g.48862 Transcript_20125/m.48862 type:complete len:146 (-) Transcript_20125:413-850(-)|eukprot:CEM06486.1 unnamed protein product [Vitrella brassicaformis CCMP3155]
MRVESSTLKEIKKAREELKESLSQIEQKIYDFESDYLNETATFGNILKGWDGYNTAINKKNARRADNAEPVKDQDRWFSRSSLSSPVVSLEQMQHLHTQMAMDNTQINGLMPPQHANVQDDAFTDEGRSVAGQSSKPRKTSGKKH